MSSKKLHCHCEFDMYPFKACDHCKALGARSVDDRVEGTPAIDSCAKCVRLEQRLSQVIKRVHILEAELYKFIS